MRKTSRLFEIIQILRAAKKPVTAEQLATDLEVAVRTIYRDIATLQAMRTPIEGESGIGYIMRQGYDLPPLNFDAEEVVALRVGGVAFDASDRLPAEGLPFEAEIPLDVPVRAPLDAPLDRDAPVGVDLALRVIVPPTLFDGLDFSTQPDVAAHVAARLNEDLTLTARVTRHDD